MSIEKKKYSRKEDIGICRHCGKHFDDYQQKHRKYICRDCWNRMTRNSQRKRASTIEGYFSIILNAVKNDKTRNMHYNDIDLQFLMDLYKLQDGRCALTGIKMTLGYGKEGDDSNTRYRKPFNLSIDRIDSNKGYTKDNVILICNCINFFKNTMTMEELYNTSKDIVNNMGRWETIKQKIDDRLAFENYINRESEVA